MTNAIESATDVLYAVAFLALFATAWSNDLWRLIKAVQNTRERRAAEKAIQNSKGKVSANMMMKETGTRFLANSKGAWEALPRMFLKAWDERRAQVGTELQVLSDREVQQKVGV